MADLLADSLTWLGGKRKAHLTRSVVYRRGQDSIPIQASKGTTPQEGNEVEGFAINAEFTDWIITAADLVLQDEQVEPETGDRIEETVGNQVFVYEVRPPFPNQPPFRYCDPNRTDMRIHTKEADVEDSDE